MKPELITLPDIPNILPDHPVISIAGAGGKTTLMFGLAKTLPGTVVTTTTTKVGETQIMSADQQLSFDQFPPQNPTKIIWVSPSLEQQNGKISGFSKDVFPQLTEICRDKSWPILLETDGASCRHIKAPAAHEPNIPVQSNVCFTLVGLDVLDCPISPEFVHRPEIFTDLTETEQNDLITIHAIIKLLEHPEGGLKNIPSNALRIAYLTHAAGNERIAAAKSIAQHLNHYDYVCIH